MRLRTISMRRSRKNGAPLPRRGFTLVSMLVAIVLLTVGLLALAGSNAQTLKLQTIAQNRTNAIAIARAYLEQVRTRDPWMLASETGVSVDGDGSLSGSGAYVRSLKVTELKTNLVEVVVTVDFPRSEKPVQLTTLLFRGNGLSGAS